MPWRSGLYRNSDIGRCFVLREWLTLSEVYNRVSIIYIGVYKRRCVILEVSVLCSLIKSFWAEVSLRVDNLITQIANGPRQIDGVYFESWES